ncbi:hypothetical protein D9599_18695 [Roseomonas sp. KE2513]|uniref:hypothetical protein n=1 Tax=Roseomonas sp. KE2513 TaxID=2479202 RepID=UPI0018DF1E5F|nr:hypothetical protein [Roseomonas sp. KE2513]MBI0537590.1 hypothetical protein [Roseomonas sp. KE2513]
MSLRIDGDIARLEGEPRVEDAEPLLAFLQGGPGRGVDLSEAGPLHAAVLGVLLALRPALHGGAGDPFNARWLLPLLAPPPLEGDHPSLFTE